MNKKNNSYESKVQHIFEKLTGFQESPEVLAEELASLMMIEIKKQNSYPQNFAEIPEFNCNVEIDKELDDDDIHDICLLNMLNNKMDFLFWLDYYFIIPTFLIFFAYQITMWTLNDIHNDKWQ